MGVGIRDPKKTIPDPGVKKAPDPGTSTQFTVRINYIYRTPFENMKRKRNLL
jgi:hypothetical protein